MQKRTKVAKICIFGILLLQLIVKPSYTQEEDLSTIREAPSYLEVIHPDQATPPTKYEVQGTISSEYSSHWLYHRGWIEFELYFRRTQGTTFRDSQILIFSVPFFRNEAYQNKEVFYQTDTDDWRLRIDRNTVHLYELEKEFYLLKGKEITPKIQITSLLSRIYVEKHVHVHHHKHRTTRSIHYYVKLKNFELTFWESGELQRLVLNPFTFGRGPYSSFFVGSAFILLILIVGIGGQNLVVVLLGKVLFESNTPQLFLYSLILGIASPFSLIALFGFLRGFDEYIGCLGFIAFISLQNGFTFHYYKTAFDKNELDFEEIQGKILTAFILFLPWLVFLCLSPHYLFRSYFFSAVIFLVDAAIVYHDSKIDRYAAIVSLALVSLRGFLMQYLFLSLYTYLFYETHSVVPRIWSFFLQDFSLLGVLAVVSAGIGFTKSTWRQRAEVEEAGEAFFEMEQYQRKGGFPEPMN